MLVAVSLLMGPIDVLQVKFAPSIDTFFQSKDFSSGSLLYVSVHPFFERGLQINDVDAE